jgi:hypothetical protein
MRWKIFKYGLIGLLVLLLVVLVWDLLFIWGAYSHFFGFFQDHFSMNIWLIKILTIVSILVFIIFVFPAIKKVLFSPFTSTNKKIVPSLIVGGFYSILFFATYLSEKDRKFDAKGEPITCVAWASDRYEAVPCNWKTHPKHGTPVISVTKDIVELLSLRKIQVNKNTTFFDPIDGASRVYYCRNGSKIEFFNSKGIHPQTGEMLLPVTKEIIKEYFNSQKDEWGIEKTVNSLEEQFKNY